MSDVAPAAHRRLQWHKSLAPAVIPMTAGAVLLLAGAAFLDSAGHQPGPGRLALAAAAGMASLCCAAVAGTWAARCHNLGEVARLRVASDRGSAELQALADSILRSGNPVPPADGGRVTRAKSPLALLGDDLQRERLAARALLAQVAADQLPDRRVDVFVNMARRMQSLLHRAIRALDELESRTEDPDQLRDMFTVDHFATRLRRYTESLAVLGGAVSRRHWSRPVPIQEVLRAAIAEVEHYQRVAIVQPVPGVLEPWGVADVIHLFAELIDNATRFSPPGTQVVLRAAEVTAGLAVDIEDRGLGMEPAQQQRVNSLLADPGALELGELLRDGRIGMFVTSVLARRHGISVELSRNIFGGTQAAVVLPPALADTRERRPGRLQPSQEEGGSQPATVGARRGPAGTGLPALPGGGDHVADSHVHGLPAAGQDARPSLPRRRGTSHMAPQLQSRPDGSKADEEAAVGAMSGLMAAFLDGARRAESGADSPDQPGGARVT